MTVRELVTRLGYEHDDKTAQRAQASFRNLQRAANVLAGAAVAAGGAMVKMATDAAEAGDEIERNSRKAGLSAETYQELAFAMEQAGVSQSTFDRAAQRNLQRMGRAEAGADKYAEAYADLGVEITDANGEMRDAEVVLEEVIESLQGMENDSERAAAAAEVFGQRAGREVAAALGEGATDIDAAREAAHEYGEVISQEAADNSADFMDRMGELRATIDGFRMMLGQAFLPRVMEVVENLRDWIAENRELIATRVEKTIEALVNVLEGVWNILRPVIGLFANLAGAMAESDKLTNILVKSGIAFVGVIYAITAAMKAYRLALTIIAGVKAIYNAVVAAAAAIKAVFNAVLLANPIGLVILAIIALVAAVIWLWKNWDEVIDFLVRAFKLWWESLKYTVDLVLGALASLGEWLVGVFQKTWEAVAGAVRAVWEPIAGFFAGLWDTIRGAFMGGLEWIWDNFLRFTPTGLVIDNWRPILDFFVDLWGQITDVFDSAIDWIRDIMSSIGDFVSDTIGGIMDAVGTVGDAIGAVGSFLGIGGGGDDNGAGNDVVRPEATGGNRNVNVNSTINATVPEGTSDEQRRALDSTARRAVHEEFDDYLNEALVNTAGAE